MQTRIHSLALYAWLVSLLTQVVLRIETEGMMLELCSVESCAVTADALRGHIIKTEPRYYFAVDGALSEPREDYYRCSFEGSATDCRDVLLLIPSPKAYAIIHSPFGWFAPYSTS